MRARSRCDMQSTTENFDGCVSGYTAECSSFRLLLDTDCPPLLCATSFGFGIFQAGLTAHRPVALVPNPYELRYNVFTVGSPFGQLRLYHRGSALALAVRSSLQGVQLKNGTRYGMPVTSENCGKSLALVTGTNGYSKSTAVRHPQYGVDGQLYSSQSTNSNLFRR